MAKQLRDAKHLLREHISKPPEKILHQLQVEEKIVSSRINSDFQAVMNENTTHIADLERHVQVADDLIKELSALFVRIESQGMDFLREFGTK